ncbi:MAG: hypothetical protein WA510_01330 [Acidobacteriaceae bacterium]
MIKFETIEINAATTEQRGWLPGCEEGEVCNVLPLSRIHGDLFRVFTEQDRELDHKDAPLDMNVRHVAVSTNNPTDQPIYVTFCGDAPGTKLEGRQEFKVSGQTKDRSLGAVILRAELSTGWVAPQ